MDCESKRGGEKERKSENTEKGKEMRRRKEGEKGLRNEEIMD